MATATTAGTELARRKIHLDAEAVRPLIDSLVPEELGTRLRGHLAAADSLVNVEDQGEHDRALSIAGYLSGDIQAIDDLVGPVAGILHQMHRAATGRREELKARHVEQKARLAGLATHWRVTEERRRADEARRIQEEEMRRLRERQAADDARALEEAERLRAAGQTQEAERIVEARIVEAEREVVQAPILVPAPLQRTDGAAARREWAADEARADKLALARAAVENPDAWLDLLEINWRAVRARIRDQGDHCRIPGVPVIERHSTAVRARR